VKLPCELDCLVRFEGGDDFGEGGEALFVAWERRFLFPVENLKSERKPSDLGQSQQSQIKEQYRASTTINR
jgi:hypothetical protein